MGRRKAKTVSGAKKKHFQVFSRFSRISPVEPKRPVNRAIRETQERLQRAAADAQNALASEVDRVSDELRSKHAAELEAAVQAEREAAEARHVAVLQQAKTSRQQETEQQVRPRLGPPHATFGLRRAYDASLRHFSTS